MACIRKRLWSGAGILMVVALSAACVTDSPKPAVRSTTEAHLQAIYKAVECLANNGAIPKQDLTRATWLKDGKVSPNVDFNDWYSTHEKAVFEGKPLTTWTNEAEVAGSSWNCPL